jgi:cytochrome c oxidase cbb3-type subunit 1
MFGNAGIWLIVGSVFSLISSLKFHNPNFLADCPWLTYGRIRPAASNCLLYGFCLQAGLGLALWLFARLGRTTLAQPLLVFVGVKLLNLGILVGVFGILSGDATGFETLEMPGYASSILFIGYLMIALWAAVTFHQRRERQLFSSQWFLLAAIFWFPWIYATANLLLVKFPLRGVAQSVITWWFANNFQVVWFGLVGLAAIFYFVPKLTNSMLQSRYLALAAFWILLLCGSWGGIPASAPVPAWMPALSGAAVVLTLFAILAAVMDVSGTLECNWSKLTGSPILLFLGFGLAAFVVAGILSALKAATGFAKLTDFTWFITAQNQLQVYGFFTMILFGAAYYIIPQLTGIDFPSPKLIKLHFWLAAAGILFIVVPFGLGGLAQGSKLNDPSIPFVEISKFSLGFLRATTFGDLLLLAGHLIFVGNIVGITVRFYRVRAESAYAAVTTRMQPAGVQA